MRTLGGLVVALGLLLSACANAPTGAGDGSASPKQSGFSYPMEPNHVVVRIEYTGGFVSPAFAIGQIPMFSLYGDGTAITPGVQIQIYPGPAFTAPQRQTLSPEAVQRILELAQTDGLLDPSADYTGVVGVADAPTTVLTVTADGRTHTFRVYALGELTQRPDGMSQAEFQARQAFLDFERRLTDLSWLPEGSVEASGQYHPSGLRVFVSGFQPSPEGPTEPATAWPLTPALSDFGTPAPGPIQGTRCGVVGGTDLDALLPLVLKANQLTPWTSGGATYTLAFRPLLPDETSC